MQQLRVKWHLAAVAAFLPAANDLRQRFRAFIKASLITGMIEIISTGESPPGKQFPQELLILTLQHVRKIKDKISLFVWILFTEDKYLSQHNSLTLSHLCWCAEM